MLEVMFILLISFLFVPPTQQSPFLYVNGLLYTSFLKAEIFVKCTIIYIIQLHFATLLQINFFFSPNFFSDYAFLIS